MKNNVKNDNEVFTRDIKYSILRLFAVFLIITATLSSELINSPAQTSESLKALKPIIMLALLGHVGIPLFIMISGAFFLDPDKNISDEDVFKKHIPKVVFIFLSWSFFYALLEQSFFSGVIAQGPMNAWRLLDMERLLLSTFMGHYHLWYLYTLLGLYMITPFLRIITQNSKKIYLNYLAFLCIAVTSTATLNNGVFHNEFVSQIFVKSNIFLPLGFMGYYVLGYAIKRIESKRALGVIFVILSVATLYYSMVWTFDLNPIGTRAPVNLALLSYFSPTVYILSITIFMIFSGLPQSGIRSGKHEIVKDIAGYTGTIYMIYPFVIETFEVTKTIAPVKNWQTLLVNNATVFLVSLILAVILSVPRILAGRWAFKA
ncbi:MAG: acyltransferase [Eubacteriales bacterium]